VRCARARGQDIVSLLPVILGVEGPAPLVKCAVYDETRPVCVAGTEILAEPLILARPTRAGPALPADL